jgi:hypothetical protein
MDSMIAEAMRRPVPDRPSSLTHEQAAANLEGEMQ